MLIFLTLAEACVERLSIVLLNLSEKDPALMTTSLATMHAVGRMGNDPLLVFALSDPVDH